MPTARMIDRHPALPAGDAADAADLPGLLDDQRPEPELVRGDCRRQADEAGPEAEQVAVCGSRFVHQHRPGR
jgi:hypothetical protein